jgi:YegS/Rv2252/BmrU family lipid kinase
MPPYLVIINPNAGRRRGLRDWPVISHLLDQAGIFYTYVFTKGSSDATEFARKAVEEGIRNIISVGGDGTMNEVVNGLFAQSTVPPAEVTLAMIPVGTGNDWGRMYGLPSDFKDAVKMIIRGNTIIQDAGVVTYIKDGAQQQRYFINVAGMGFDAIVTEDTNRRKQIGRTGKIAYLVSLLKSLFRYSCYKVRIEADGKRTFDGELFSANVGICRFSGGGMMQVPAAIADDGLFDITIISKMSKWNIIRNVSKLYDGSFVKLKQVSNHRAARVVVKSDEGILLEADGESLGTGPFEFTVLPKVLKFIVPRT